MQLMWLSVALVGSGLAVPAAAAVAVTAPCSLPPRVVACCPREPWVAGCWHAAAAQCCFQWWPRFGCPSKSGGWTQRAGCWHLMGYRPVHWPAWPASGRLEAAPEAGAAGRQSAACGRDGQSSSVEGGHSVRLRSAPHRLQQVHYACMPLSWADGAKVRMNRQHATPACTASSPHAPPALRVLLPAGSHEGRQPRRAVGQRRRARALRGHPAVCADQAQPHLQRGWCFQLAPV